MASILESPIVGDLHFISIQIITSHLSLAFLSAVVPRDPLVSPSLLWPLGKLPMLPAIHCLRVADARLLQPQDHPPRERRGDFWGPGWLLSLNCSPSPTSWSKILKVSFQLNIIYLSILVWRKQENCFCFNDDYMSSHELILHLSSLSFTFPETKLDFYDNYHESCRTYCRNSQGRAFLEILLKWTSCFQCFSSSPTLGLLLLSFFWHPLISLLAVQSLSHVQLCVTPWTAAYQISLSFTISQSLLILFVQMSILCTKQSIVYTKQRILINWQKKKKNLKWQQIRTFS